jgi:hypothetical protein
MSISFSGAFGSYLPGAQGLETGMGEGRGAQVQASSFAHALLTFTEASWNFGLDSSMRPSEELLSS